MVGADNILGLLPTGRHDVPPIRLANSFILSWLEPRFCPSRFPPVHGLLLVPVRANLLVVGVVRPLVNGGDGESNWGLVGLGIGVEDFQCRNYRFGRPLAIKEGRGSLRTSFI